MKNYLIENRFKFLFGGFLFFAVLSLGAYCRPAYDFAFNVLVPAPKVYVAEKSDVEVEIEKYLASSDYQTEVKAEAEGRVKLRMAIQLNGEAGIAAKKSEQYQTRALNGISSKTATATIALETKAGRRPN